MSTIPVSDILYFLRELRDQYLQKGETLQYRTLEEAARLVLRAAPDSKGWHIDSNDSDRVYCKLSEHHEVCINHTSEGLIIDVVDQRTGDIVYTAGLDEEILGILPEEDDS